MLLKEWSVAIDATIEIALIRIIWWLKHVDKIMRVWDATSAIQCFVPMTQNASTSICSENPLNVENRRQTTAINQLSVQMNACSNRK